MILATFLLYIYMYPYIYVQIENANDSTYKMELGQSSQIVLQKRIGSGGFGVVYKGTWRGQTVAIKQLHSNSSKEILKILRDEADFLERAKNRHIIQFYCIDEYEGSPVMITDF